MIDEITAADMKAFAYAVAVMDNRSKTDYPAKFDDLSTSAQKVYTSIAKDAWHWIAHVRGREK